MKPWHQSLEKILSQLMRNNPKLKLAVLGIGNELRGDDALGLVVLHRLRQAIPETNEVMLIDAGSMPENFIFPLRNFAPHLIVIIDAANMGELPGTIALIEANQISGARFSTHGIPLDFLIAYLEMEIGCSTIVLGVQPKTMFFTAPLSDEVHQAVETLVMKLVVLISKLDICQETIH